MRPLGVGEILDRAVTLFVRRFAVIILILAIVALPVAILQFIATPQTTGMIDDLRRVLAVPPGHTGEQQALLKSLFANNHISGWAPALVLLSTVLSTLSLTACVIAVAQAYAGELPSVREVYRAALRRWVAALVALVVYAALFFALIIGLVIVVFFTALAIGALAAVSTIAATIVGIPMALVALVATLAGGALFYLMFEMSMVSIALEDPNPMQGIAAGVRRTLSPPIFWRSLLVATIVFGVLVIGTTLVLAIAGTLSVISGLSVVYPILAVIGGIALNALVTTFIVVHAIDIRVRREGYDLLVAAHEPAV